MSFVIRNAVTADLKWINSNEEGWTIHEHASRSRLVQLRSLEADRVFVATDERGKPLGWMCVIKDSSLVLHMLYVDRQHRGCGVARALVEDLLAREKGRIILGGWDRALFKMWNKFGFRYEGDEERDAPHFSENMVRPATG